MMSAESSCTLLLKGSLKGLLILKGVYNYKGSVRVLEHCFGPGSLRS